MNDSHLATWEAETRVTNSARAWLAWHDEATRLAGRSLDGDRSVGNESPDPYCLDEAYDAFLAGATPAQYVGTSGLDR